MNLSLEEARARMKEHFPDGNSGRPEGWENLWHKGDFLPWDRGLPNPALEDALTDRTDVLGPRMTKDQRRRTALVPGCGRGYDVLLLASFGYDTIGLEVSESAVQRCCEEKEKNGHKYAIRDTASGAGNASFVNGDFFDSTWTEEVGMKTFDLIYDYTVSVQRTYLPL